MAKLSADGKYVTVEKGDTLWGIAEKYLGSGIKYKQLAAINKKTIPNPDLIYVGQKVYLTSTSEAGSSSGSASASSNKPEIIQFGELSNTEGTLFSTWRWSKSHTDSYKVAWTYDLGNGVWLGSTSTISVDEDYPELSRQSTYKVPNGAKRVQFKVKPISETKDDEKKTTYFSAEWSSVKTWSDITPLETPEVPDIVTNKFKLTATLINIDIADATHIEFQVVRDNSPTPFSTKKAEIITSDASYVFDINAGSQYKVRCRAYNSENKTYSDWTEYSESKGTIPNTPDSITELKALSETSVQLAWSSVENASGYDIEYTTKVFYFDSATSEVESASVGEGVTSTPIEGLTSGEEYFFRVKAKNNYGSSGWTDIKSIVIGEAPAAPTTWSSTTTAITGDSVNLYWVHNAEDESNQTYAYLEYYDSPICKNCGEVVDPVNDSDECPYCGTAYPLAIRLESESIDNELLTYVPLTEDEQNEGKINSCILKTNSYSEGTSIKWRVKTAGITLEPGDWSVQRTIDVYAPPTLQMNMTDANGNSIETLTSFPFYVKAIAGPKTQAAIGYHLSIRSNEIYETVDNIGNPIVVNKNQEVYSKYFNIRDVLSLELSAGDIDLMNNIEYTVTCIVYMNSGLTVEASHVFTVAWEDKYYSPNAAITIDEDTMTANIRPYCEDNKLVYYQITYKYGVYTKTSTELESVWGEPVPHAYTISGEKVYSGVTAEGEDVYFCSVIESQPVEDVLLSVYRREFDGSFTELATGLDSSKATTIIDPHPALDFARYRIVATSKPTGSVSYYDLPGYPVGGNAVIIQWDEAWTNFETSEDDVMEQPPWSGSLLKLPYNIDVSESNSSDVSLIEYAGRKHPVTYYGTHLGVTAKWDMEIPKDDKETIYALRRLARWMGDVYIREPSGSGYWATISVSFNQKHCETTIPISFSISQVEGGV